MPKVCRIDFIEDGSLHTTVIGQISGDGKPVEKILEHSAQGEGDKWYWTVVYEDGTSMCHFNIERAYYDA